ncbi:cation-transporting ATPase 4 [Histoplasma mississippiense (nom. inval.)]|uniref:cation-transporting ATPase 4 n=1 Tax=Ajellomyces capsulatus (strain NAm1 / WU24) TaxID=2059318 RepID=UPI000157B866|nr:cation-transporting ATPase 4 [Histoplasma mississippiense (nom. inval.)]EDN03268.1 cation-transporting ATPase 4 [Histoplasma mississippiense (nom. inval.)]
MPGEAMLPAEVKRVDHCLQQADRDSDKHDHMDWVLLQSINNCEPFISSREILSLTLPLALLPRCILSWDLVCVYQLYLPDLASKASTGIMPRLVDNSQIQSASLHNPLPLQLHAYVWPFLIIWPTFLAVYLSPERYDTYIQGSEWTFLWAGGIFTLQALVWLSTKWNVNVQALFTTSTAKSVYSAKLIKVSPVVNAGSAEICPLLREKYAGKDDISFLFQKRRFLYYPDRNTFAPLSYAIDTEPKPLLKTFQHSQGLKTDKEIGENQNHYGDNTFDIPVPTFTELFKEHAVAPFFVFQVFCVGLWLLDEYWYYSLFTLLMLVTFESTVVWQRQRTLNEFRGMSIKPYEVWVYRKNAWTEIKSDKLLPGDVLSVNRTREDSGVACDILMIEGSVIVNEAMLSGESTPLLKDSIQLRPEDDQLDPEGLDKNSFLYGGTKVLQITHPNSAASPPNGIPTPPDNGALGVVVKTGFETSQGSLVRTMIYSTERVSANNVEALLFILFLLTFAIAASWYVWQEGVAKDRKRSKLLLDCVLIITSVVPPELPMELSLAVNTSLTALSKFAIFCTEPFRIPYAGRIDIACFDKTGTLTGEDLLVDGIAGLTLGHASAKTDKHGAHTDITPVEKVANETTLVLATAHALVKLDEGEIVGDPMEKATLNSLGWVLGRDDILTSKATGASRQPGRALDSVQIKRRFQFSSALKRQSAIATDAGYTTLMCGDGTNDVGALKQAHVGVALLNGSQDDLNKIAEHWRNTKMKEIYEKQVSLMQRFNQPAPPIPANIAHLYPPGPNNPHYEKALIREAQRKGITAPAAIGGNGIPTVTSPGAHAIQQSTMNLTPQQLQQRQASVAAAGFADKLTATMMEQELDDNEPPTIKLGDASVAAPFTSKLANVIAIPNIIRQGRCTLVATIQMYKILALNCLISAYSLSVIYLDGIRFGDGQATISGILMSVCFLSISRAKSVEGLSKERPQPNIFNMYIMGSVLGQFAVHVATLIYLSNYVYTIEPKKEVIDLEGEFEPSLLNSAIYLLQLIQQISTFSINYQGRPFRESIRENRGMYWGLILTSGVAFSCATEFIPELNEKLRLVPFTTMFKVTLTALMLADYIGCWLIENILKTYFSDYRPKDIAVRRPDQLAWEEERKKKEAVAEENEKESKRKV